MPPVDYCGQTLPTSTPAVALATPLVVWNRVQLFLLGTSTGSPPMLPAKTTREWAGGLVDSMLAPADSSELASESLALQAVLVKLRREHDAKGALTLLDQSQPLFARGALAQEAQVARVDALLALGRQGEALAILNQLPLAHVGRGGELCLLRAELRAKEDCGLALADFDVLVRRPLSPPLAERALYGRAACEVRVGDNNDAQRDFRDYLTRFPQGRFADRARGQLSP